MSTPESQGAAGRLVPDEPLPPYTYVPGGKFPHPVRDPSGHRAGQPADDPPPLDPARWGASRLYLFGCDLFNHGFYWEAHETWEAVWIACGRRGTAADFLKGLIKLAAAGVKAREGRPVGIARHAARAAELLTQVQRQTHGATFAGLDLASTIEFAQRLGQDFAMPESTNVAVEVIFAHRLWPTQ